MNISSRIPHSRSRSITTTEQVVIALRDLGVDIELHDAPISGAFIPGVWLDGGKVNVCLWAAHPGDVLHESGHWAIVPSRFRSAIVPGDIDGPEFRAAIKAYTQSSEAFEQGPDHWVMKALLQMGDCEAQAWSYAAACRIGFDPKLAFCFRYNKGGVPKDRQPYGGEGEDIWFALSLGEHFGVNGLQASGMCIKRKWPNMLRWVQP